MEFAALALLAVFVFLLVSRLAKKRTGRKPARGQSSIEQWAQAEIASVLARELELEPSDVATTLDKSPDPEVVTKLEQAVRRIEIAYERAPGEPGAVEARVEIHLETGTIKRSTKRFPWAALPGDIVADFDKSGAAHAYRAWCFPWQS